MTKKTPPPAEVVPEEETVEESPPETPAPPKVDDVVSSLIVGFPKLAIHQTDLTLLVQLWMEVVEPPSGKSVPLEETLLDLELFWGTSVDGVASAIYNIQEVIEAERLEVAKQFEMLTGTTVGVGGMTIDERFREERREQKELSKQARTLLTDVSSVAAKLNIEDPAKRPASEEKEGVLMKLRKKAADKLVETGLAVRDSDEVEFRDPDWLTDPLLEMDDDDLKLFARVVQISNNNNRTEALASLERRNLDSENLGSLLERVYDTAYSQIDQSAQIEDSASTDTNIAIQRLKATEDVAQIVADNANYFSPE